MEAVVDFFTRNPRYFIGVISIFLIFILWAVVAIPRKMNLYRFNHGQNPIFVKKGQRYPKR